MRDHVLGGSNTTTPNDNAVQWQLLTTEQLSRLAFLQNKAMTRFQRRIMELEELTAVQDVEIRDLKKRLTWLEEGT